MLDAGKNHLASVQHPETSIERKRAEAGTDLRLRASKKIKAKDDGERLGVSSSFPYAGLRQPGAGGLSRRSAEREDGSSAGEQRECRMGQASPRTETGTEPAVA